jgi:hypothetical protein
MDPIETALLERTRKLLGAVAIPLVRAVELCSSEAEIVCVAVDESVLTEQTDSAIVLDAKNVYTPLYSLFSTKACAINRLHPWWQSAVAAAKKDPGFAALAFARMVLLHNGALTAQRDRALFDRFALPDVCRMSDEPNP